MTPLRTSLFILTFTFGSSVLIAQNKINSRLFYLKPHLYNSKSKITKFDLSSYNVNVSLPIDERNKFYGEVVYKNKKVHSIEDFYSSPTMVEIQNKIKSDLSGFRSKKKIALQKELMINTSVEVFYPKLRGFIRAKSFAKVRLAATAIENNTTLISRKYESLYITNGMDNDFEGDLSMTVEEGENVTVGMALRKCLDQFYADVKQVLSLNEI